MIFEEYKKYLLTRRCLLLLVVLVAGMQGCKKFVQIPPPDTEIVTADVFNNIGTATAATTAIYTQMFNNSESWEIAQNLGLLSDELTNHSPGSTLEEFYTNALIATNTDAGEWVNAYYYIYQANAIITALKNNGNITPAVVQQLTGEALFMRAFWHFYLTNEYGDVPLVTTTLYTVNESISRTPRAQVYAQIILDLQSAQALLNANYVDASDTAITTERTRPTKAAAQALLARAYLYTQKYDSAEIQSTNVINNGLYQLCTNLNPAGRVGRDSVFLMNSTAAIWQLYTPQPTRENTIDAQNFILIGAPTTGTRNSTTISPELLNGFEAGDLRRSNWIDSIIKSGTTYYFPFKYQAYSTSTITEYTMVLRLAEQYLIRAEAEANLGDMADATKDLNVIRSRAGLGPSPTLTNSASLQQADSAILHERQVELFTEWGSRWFDLVRTDSSNTVLGSPGNVCRMKGGVWNSYDTLFPIPQSEILLDHNLTQNLGY
jgi:starch-binding outer membrane protein, SusD/RagB family